MKCAALLKRFKDHYPRLKIFYGIIKNDLKIIQKIDKGNVTYRIKKKKKTKNVIVQRKLL